MKSPATLIRDIVAPHHQTLWQRAMVDEKNSYDELPGTEVPIFNPELTHHEEVDGTRVLYNKHDMPFGTRRVFETETALGIDYITKLYQPLGGNQHDFYIDIDTPVGTGIGGVDDEVPSGLNEEVAIRLMRELGVPVILKGPEFSGSKSGGARRLAQVVLAATNISQSLSAEVSMAISAEIVHNEGMPTNAVAYGKSRGAMIGGKKWPYAHDRGINIVHNRLIDPCVGKRAFDSAGDVLRYGMWVPADIARSVPSFAKFALEGNLRSRAKTIETEREYLLGMLFGTIPSLLSGEEMGSRIPLHKGVSLVHMRNNLIADTPEYLAQFADHKNFDDHEVINTHSGGIVLPRNIRRTVRHLGDFATEFDRAGGDELKVNWKAVHNNPRKQQRATEEAA